MQEKNGTYISGKFTVRSKFTVRTKMTTTDSIMKGLP
jgi:hypothetical protein